MKVTFVAAILLASALSAAPITGLYNTGESTTGTADNYWTVVAPPGPAQVVTLPLTPNPWLPNTVDSSWVWLNETGQPTGNPLDILTYTFSVSFTLDPSLDPNAVLIIGRWVTDNTGTQIRVNGHDTGYTSNYYDVWSTFALYNHFVTGLNTIQFVVEDYGLIAGFRAEFVTAEASLLDAQVPEPGTWALLVGGLTSMIVLRRRSS